MERKERVVRLRDAWLSENEHGWLGKGGHTDKKFWQKVEQDHAYKTIRQEMGGKISNTGIFIIPFQNFMQYFNQLHYCDILNNTKVLSEQLLMDKSSRGHFYDLEVKQKCVHTIELTQSRITEQSMDEKAEEGICRMSLVLVQENS